MGLTLGLVAIVVVIVVATVCLSFAMLSSEISRQEEQAEAHVACKEGRP